MVGSTLLNEIYSSEISADFPNELSKKAELGSDVKGKWKYHNKLLSVTETSFQLNLRIHLD